MPLPRAPPAVPEPAKSGRRRDDPAHGWVWDLSSLRAWVVWVRV